MRPTRTTTLWRETGHDIDTTGFSVLTEEDGETKIHFDTAGSKALWASNGRCRLEQTVRNNA